jgi:hypothetical protein
MKKKLKTVGSGLFTVLVLAVILYFTFRNDYKAILENIRHTSPLGIAMILLLSMITLLLQSYACMLLLRTRKSDLRYGEAFNANLIGYFANVATMSVGSIPMQSYYLHRHGVMVGSSAGILTLQYVFMKVSILLYATLMLLFEGRWFLSTNPTIFPYVLLGYLIFFVVIAALVLVCTWDKLLHLALALIDRLPKTEKWEQRKHSWSDNLNVLYTESQQIMRSRRIVLVNVGLRMMRLFFFYTIPYVSLRMLGVTDLTFWQVQMLSSLMLLISGALPNVAGMGPAEFSFVLLFGSYMGSAQASSAMLLFRVATYFFPFLVSAVVFFRVQKQIVQGSSDDSDNPSVS